MAYLISCWASSILAKRFVLIIVSAVLCSCSWPRYPSAWPPLVETRDRCPKLSGVYDNLDEEKRLSLTSIFNLPFPGTELLSSPVMISGVEDGVLEVTLWSDGRLVAKNRLVADKKDFSCEDGWVELGTTGFTGPQLAGPYGKYTRLSAQLDGSLVAKKGFWAVGLAYLVVPLGTSEYTWHRFKTRNIK